MAAFLAFDQEAISAKLLEPPALMVRTEAKAKPQIMNFELIDTPSSAQTAAPPEKTNLASNKNTRAQDLFESERALKNEPHMEGKNEDSKDTRPRMIAPEPPRPPAKPKQEAKTPAPPKEILKEPEKKEPPKEEPPKMKEAAASVSVAPRPKPPAPPPPEPQRPKREALQLAKRSDSSRSEMFEMESFPGS
jgi:hypothetical protein